MSGLAKEARPDLRGLWVLRQQASEQGEAIGKPKVLREMLKRLAAKEWAGKAVKMRAKGEDGRAVVAVLGRGAA